MGDFNLDAYKSPEEEMVITNHGWRDVVHDFTDASEWTKPKTKRKPTTKRIDKVATQTYPEEGSAAQYWRCVGAKVIGKVPIAYYAAKGEDITMIEQDNIVRTPSDHMGIVADFEFQL